MGDTPVGVRCPKQRLGGNRRKCSIAHVIPNPTALKDKMLKSSALAKTTLEKNQADQKWWYDAKMQVQQVVLILHSAGHKLQIRWHHTYKVIGRVGEVDYEITSPD